MDRPQSALPTHLGGVFEDLLDVDVHLAQKGGGDGVAVAFVGQDGGAALEAQGLAGLGGIGGGGLAEED